MANRDYSIVESLVRVTEIGVSRASKVCEDLDERGVGDPISDVRCNAVKIVLVGRTISSSLKRKPPSLLPPGLRPSGPCLREAARIGGPASATTATP